MVPFPELVAGFVGFLALADHWHWPLEQPLQEWEEYDRITRNFHLASTLFVGGSPNKMTERMVDALHRRYFINVLCGLYSKRGLKILQGMNMLPIRFIERIKDVVSYHDYLLNEQGEETPTEVLTTKPLENPMWDRSTQPFDLEEDIPF